MENTMKSRLSEEDKEDAPIFTVADFGSTLTDRTNRGWAIVHVEVVSSEDWFLLLENRTGRSIVERIVLAS